MTAELGEPSRGVEQDHWDLTLDRFGLESAEVGSDAAERLALAIAQLHGAVVGPPEPVLPPLRRAELCWRAHRLLLEWRKRTVAFPDWLDVLEQQLVLSGAQLWRERVGLDEEAGERALELFERLVVLFDPCPAWIRLACLELRQLSSEQMCQELETALEDQEGDQVLLEQLALCCDRCCREALERGDWGLAMERQAVAERTLHRLDEGHPHGSQARWEGYAALVIAIVDRLKPVLIGEAGHSLPDAVRARLYDRVERMLKGYHALPIEPPEWLAVVELQLLQEGAQLWKVLIGREPRAAEHAQVLFGQLAARLDPCPEWVRHQLKNLESIGNHLPALDASELEVLLRTNSPAELEKAVTERLASLVATNASGQSPLQELITAFGCRWAEGHELTLEHFNGLERAWSGWQAGRDEGLQTAWPASDPTRQSLSLALDPRELRTLRQRVLGVQEQGPQLEGFDEEDLTWWTEEALACFTEIGLWGEGVVWSTDQESLWLYLPLLQAISCCSGRIPEIHRPPEPVELAGLMADPQVLVLRNVPPQAPGQLRTNLEALLAEVEAQHTRTPYRLAVVEPGNHRLPLCQELRRRLSISCVGLDINHTNDILNVAKDTGAAVSTA